MDRSRFFGEVLDAKRYLTLGGRGFLTQIVLSAQREESNIICELKSHVFSGARLL